MISIQFAMALAATISQLLIASAADLPLPPLPPWYPLQPWQISSLDIYNPHTSPYGPNSSGLVLTITNPKMIAATRAPHGSGGGYVTFLNTTARCELHWKADDLTPYGYSSNSCVPDLELSSYSYPQWTLTLQELHVDLDGPGDYFLDLGFELVHNSTIYGGQAYKRMNSGVIFQSGTNLQGQCAEDGLCKYEIKDGSAPVLLQPVLNECKSACG